MPLPTPPRIRLQPKIGGASMVVAPAWGGRVCELVLPCNGKVYSMIDGFEEGEAIDQDQRYKSAPLIPFPNRVNRGRYVFDGIPYQLPINEPRQGHAIHGLLYNCPMIGEVQIAEQTAQIQLTHSYAGQTEGYPFSFDFAVTYSLSEQDGFSCTTTVKNTGSTDMPLGVGWHPYLNLSGDLAEWTMQLPRCEVYTLDDMSIPTGNRQTYSAFNVPTKLDDVHFNDCFGLISKASRCEIVFSSAASGQQVVFWMESGPGQYLYFQLFTPPDRTSIAVEPMSCCSDAVNNHDGLLRLKPGNTFDAA
ncbi:MAG: hypothetical protein H7Z72_07685, partial [Bacteroidetes bacterium]|nr:hypothetical protein [Fibrella sp.]